MLNILNDKGLKCSNANMASLSIRQNGDSYESHMRAAVTCERFLCSASLLPDGEFLGWQADIKTFSNTAFSSPGVKAAMEDFDWIFHQCADTSSLVFGQMENLCTEGRKVYMLSSITGSSSDVDIPEQMGSCVSDWDMIKMMAETGAVIRIIAGGAAKGAKGRGMIFISLPDEMTLRMRCMLSLAFPHMSADETGRLPEETDEPEYLPDDCFLEGMARILSALMCWKDGIEPTEGNAPDDTIPSGDGIMDGNSLENDTHDGGDIGYTDIGGMELSIRSYNCLKRAGINTVEELLALSDDDLVHVRNLGRKSVEEIKRKLARIQGRAEAASSHETDYMAMLDGLIGLTDAKEQIRKIVAFAKMKQDMSKDGNANIPVVLNMGFVGNPGTAKTTVARIAAGIFYEIGLLSRNGLVEAGRADLVGKYVGHTAVKVKDAFRKAKGRVLFIDEAYSLVDDKEGSFGDEAINTIVQEMENSREETIVIFAGYPGEMERFFSRNPGLKSRVPFTINFSDYSVEEMVKIAELEAKNRGFSISMEASGKLAAICSAAAHRPEMGNGRFCRNLIENAILEYASRMYGNNGSDADKNHILTAEDFTHPTGMGGTKKIPMGFHA